MSNKIKKPEILAPCGEFDSVIGAINAGADAIYLGAELFSARAYAKNLDNDGVIKAINYAHLFGVKVYLTLNTLLKNKELEEALLMLREFYLAGLDAVIVQDLGLLSVINRCLPNLDIHASTQMSIMTKAGIEFLKSFNVTRVVPARELTALEIGELKAAGLEIECFVHGAMCYGYSGKCLLSSLAGGRSGNRGRCAGPCRKPYKVDGGNTECYPISMKDMCTITCIDKLIDVGVDSFKIEGRMKAPEYSAGVSLIYRKYVDLYCETGKLEVSKKDLGFLSSLYIRSEIEEGYIQKIHGSNMITMSKPSYNGQDKALIGQIRDDYISYKKKLPVNITIYSYVGSPLAADCVIRGRVNRSFEGPVVLEAINKALDEAAYIKQFSKVGDTDFSIGKIKVFTDGMGFLPVSAINDFRRNIFTALYDALVETVEDCSRDYSLISTDCKLADGYSIYAGVKQMWQFNKVRVRDYIDGIIVDLMLVRPETIDVIKTSDKAIYLRMPEILRQRMADVVSDRLRFAVDNLDITGIYVGGIDALSICREVCPDISLYGDYGLYVFNAETEAFVLEYLNGYTASLENNEKELSYFASKDKRQMVAYGYIPVMYSANCIHNTIRKCCDNANSPSGDKHILYDDARRGFVATANHELCYNTIYNCVPFDVIQKLNGFVSKGENGVYRLEFSIEDEGAMDAVLDRYETYYRGGCVLMPDGYEYTNGHLKRGVE